MNAADEAECKLLSDLVQEHFGLSFSGVRRDILASRVRPRIAAHPTDGYAFSQAILSLSRSRPRLWFIAAV